jgi:hypothetical protein
MTEVQKDFANLCALLNANGVEYLIWCILAPTQRGGAPWFVTSFAWGP